MGFPAGGYRVPGMSSNSGYYGSNTDPTTEDPRQMYLQGRRRAIAFGDQFDQGMRDYGDYQAQLGEGYRNWGQDMYGGILNGGAGYTPDQQAGILQGEQYNNLRPSGEELSMNFLNDPETAAIRGNPRSWQNSFDPEQARAVNRDAAARLREGYQDLTGRLDDTTNTARAAYGQAIDPDALRQRAGVEQGVMGDIGSATGRIHGMLDSPELGVSDRYMNKRGFSDQDVNDIKMAAARKVGASNSEAIRSLEDRAAASGNASPMAVAAARARLQRMTNIDSADAMADADIRARQAQKNAEQDIEDTRLAAAKFRAGTATQADLELLRGSTAARLGSEAQRMGGEQYLSGARMKAAGDVADIMGRNSAISQQARLGAEGQIGQNERSTENWIQGTGIEGERGSEAAQQARDQFNAANRQQTQMYNSGQNYGRGMAITGALSAGNRALADEYQNQMREGRGWVGGQQAMAGNNYLQAGQQRLAAQRQTADQENQAAQGYAAWQQRPNRFMRNVMGPLQTAMQVAGQMYSASQRGGGGGGG